MKTCKQCGAETTRMYCSVNCGNKFRYQNNPEVRARALKCAERYRDQNRDKVNEYFRLRKSSTAAHYQEMIYWVNKYGTEQDRIDLAEDILESGIGNYTTASMEDFIVEVLGE